MKLVKFPNPILTSKALQITEFDFKLFCTLQDMCDLMEKEEGIGLAANQVGESGNFFTIKLEDERKFGVVNPTVISQSLKKTGIKEGCLSAPGEKVPVNDRSEWIKISFQDHTGKRFEMVFKGIDAICVQHEIEHLSGKSILHNLSVPKPMRKRLQKKWGIL